MTDKLNLTRRAWAIAAATGTAALAISPAARAQEDAQAPALFADLFAQIGQLAVPDGVNVIQTTGHSVAGLGAARYASTDVEEATPWRARSANGRWFALAEPEPDLRMFGALGDDAHDDSAAWNDFIAYLVASATGGRVASGVYRVPAAKPAVLSGPLRLTGEVGAVLDGRGSAAANLLQIVGSSVRLDGLEFRSFSDLVVGGNDGQATFGSSWTGDVDEIVIERCRFLAVRRVLVCRLTDTGPALRNLRLVDNVVDGKLTPDAATATWGAFHVGVNNLGPTLVSRNVIRNIDATAAAGSPPANIGNGRAILLGGNNPSDTFAHGRWVVSDNVIENITDNRARARSTNPEVGGIRLTGGAHCVVSGNSLANINSTGAGIDADCEGIYVKTPYSIITGNTLRNAGLAEGAICVKGHNLANDGGGDDESYGYKTLVTNNVLWTDYPQRTVGIGIQTSHCVVDGNHLTGFGGSNDRWAPIFVDAAQHDQTKIRANTILDTVGRNAIRILAYGQDIEVIGNTIRGVSGRALTSANHCTGILIDNSNGNGTNTAGLPLKNLRIEGNSLGDIVAPAGFNARAIVVSGQASKFEDLTIAGNVLTSAANLGIFFTGGEVQFDRVRIRDNDLAKAADPYSVSGKGVAVSNITASGNQGWLYAEFTYDVPTAEAGGEIYFDVPMDDIGYRDFVQVGWSGSLVQGGIGLRASWEVVAPSTTTPDARAVRIYLRNPGPSGVNVGSRTWFVRVEKHAL